MSNNNTALTEKLIEIKQLSAFLDELNPSKVCVLTDDNSFKHCYPLVKPFLPQHQLLNLDYLPEARKNLETCQYLWQELFNLQADRQTLIINIGGGLLSDIGGFVASTYQRGLRFINIPTTLLGMVDAAIGGKTGINFGGSKNQIGSFHKAECVVVQQSFLETLPHKQLLSGFGEVMKYACIAQPSLLQFNLLAPDTAHLEQCIKIKKDIVLKDFRESGARKILNFGHTIGHAIEALSHDLGASIPHGWAVAWGILGEAWISQQQLHFTELKKLERTIKTHFPPPEKRLLNPDLLIAKMQHDKKNLNGETRMVLLKALGQPEIDHRIPEKRLEEAIHYLADTFHA